MGSFEESVHHGFTIWEAEQEEKEFFEEHGCMECDNYSKHNRDYKRCEKCTGER